MLSQERKAIDEIDQKLVQLLEKRMNHVTQIAKIKSANNMPVLDEGREQLIYQKIDKYVKNDIYIPAIHQVYSQLLETSRSFQKEVENKK